MFGKGTQTSATERSPAARFVAQALLSKVIRQATEADNGITTAPKVLAQILRKVIRQERHAQTLDMEFDVRDGGGGHDSVTPHCAQPLHACTVGRVARDGPQSVEDFLVCRRK